MPTGYENSYGSDWTRHRTSDNRTDIDMLTELGTTLSSTTAPAPALQRLSFARHPSVLGSSLGPAPLIEKIVRPANQNMGDGIVFGTMAQSTSLQKNSSSYNQPCIDVQAVLDGLTSKPLGLIDFKRFLNKIRRGKLQVELINNWITCAPILVDFLLEFKRYADGFSRLSLRDQSKCPHPFEIICFLNSQNPEGLSDSGESDSTRLRQDVLSPLVNTPLELKKMPQDFEALSPHEQHHTRTPKMDPKPTNRHVNWAPSVRSNKHLHDTDWDGAGSTLSAILREGSILRAARHHPKAYSRFSSSGSLIKLKGVDPEHQPMRSSFNNLLRSYLGNSTSLNERNGLLAICQDINFDSIQRAILEAKYTNHPAVLSGIVAEILVGLNLHVLPVFVASSTTTQKSQTNSRSKTLWGCFSVLSASILNFLMMIVPSPLTTQWKNHQPIPKIYRLLLFPVIWTGLFLIIIHRMKTYCLLCWKNKFTSAESGFPPNHETIQTDFLTTNKSSIDAANNPSGNVSLPPIGHHASRALHETITCLITSFVFAIIIQTIFWILPFLP